MNNAQGDYPADAGEQSYRDIAPDDAFAVTAGDKPGNETKAWDGVSERRLLSRPAAPQGRQSLFRR